MKDKPRLKDRYPLMKNKDTGQIFRPIDKANLPGVIYDIVEKQGIKDLTRNSCCPCGSGKRYKKCHGVREC